MIFGICICGTSVLCNTQAEALLAVAAFIASLVAILGLSVRDWIWRPILRVTHVHDDVYCDKASLRLEKNGQSRLADCYYFSLRVENTGTRPAHAVEVFVGNLHSSTV